VHVWAKNVSDLAFATVIPAVFSLFRGPTHRPAVLEHGKNDGQPEGLGAGNMIREVLENPAWSRADQGGRALAGAHARHRIARIFLTVVFGGLAANVAAELAANNVLRGNGIEKGAVLGARRAACIFPALRFRRKTGAVALWRARGEQPGHGCGRASACRTGAHTETNRVHQWRS